MIKSTLLMLLLGLSACSVNDSAQEADNQSPGVDASLPLDSCEATFAGSQEEKITCTGGLEGADWNWSCECSDGGTLLSTCVSSAEDACADNCCEFESGFVSYSEPCDPQSDACSGDYECVAAAPQHPEQAEGDFCMLSCDAHSDCGDSPSCVCKGLGGVMTSGPVPDGYCECS